MAFKVKCNKGCDFLTHTFMLQYLFLSYFIGIFIFGFVFFKYFYFLEIQDKLIMSIFWLMVVSSMLVLLFTVTFIDFNFNEVRRFLKIFNNNVNN